MKRSLVALVLLPVLALGGCRKADPAVQAAATTSGSTVVATLDGAPITRAEVEAAASSDLLDLKQQEYEILKRTLGDMVQKRLLAQAAAARGVTPERYLQQEVGTKLTAADPGDINALYQQHKARFGNMPREAAFAQIEAALAQRREAELTQELHASLRAKADLRIALEAPRQDVVIPADAPALGPKDAPITLVQFLDYRCGYCQRAQVTVNQVLEKYKDKVRFVVRDYPLDPNGPNMHAFEAAHCAGEQGKYWEFHNGLLERPRGYDRNDFMSRATELGLDAAKFGSCLDADRHQEYIMASRTDGGRLGVSGTPAFYINGVKIAGARPFSEFVEIIDDELKRAGRS